MKPSSMALPTSLERRREADTIGAGWEGGGCGFESGRWKRCDEEQEDRSQMEIKAIAPQRTAR
jgi:hypothetical protein